MRTDQKTHDHNINNIMTWLKNHIRSGVYIELNTLAQQDIVDEIDALRAELERVKAHLAIYVTSVHILDEPPETAE